MSIMLYICIILMQIPLCNNVNVLSCLRHHHHGVFVISQRQEQYLFLFSFFFFFFEPWIWKHTDSIMNKRIKFLQSISNYNIITVFQIRGMFKHLHLLNCSLNFQKRFFFHLTDLRYHLFFFDECRIYHFQIIS